MALDEAEHMLAVRLAELEDRPIASLLRQLLIAEARRRGLVAGVSHEPEGSGELPLAAE